MIADVGDAQEFRSWLATLTLPGHLVYAHNPRWRQDELCGIRTMEKHNNIVTIYIADRSWWSLST